MADKDIEDIRREKLEKLKEEQSERNTDDQDIQDQQQKREAMKKQKLRQILTEDARRRIENVKMVDEERAQKVEQALISQVPDPSQLNDKIGESKIREILSELKEDTSFDIKRR